MNTLVILPALVPETILGVGLLVLIKAIDQPRTYLLLLLGHILLALPFVVLVVQARLIGIRRVYEEAALSLGATARSDVPRDHAAAAAAGRVRQRAAGLHHLVRQHDGEPVLAAGRRRDHADPDPVDAEDFDQPRGQCARNADDRDNSRRAAARRRSSPRSYRNCNDVDKREK